MLVKNLFNFNSIEIIETTPVEKLKVSDLFILLLPTAFDAVGSFCLIK